MWNHRLAVVCTPIVLAALVVTSIGTSFVTQAHADEVYTFVVKKQEQKAKTRWSLSEWLETRDRMRLMDLWLSMHSPSPYEFFLGTDYTFGQAAVGPSFNGLSFSLGGYAQAVGLELRRESLAADMVRSSALLGLRLFGYQIQGTHLALLVGLKQDSLNSYTARNAVLGGRLSLYLTKFFGIEGNYRHFFASASSLNGLDFSGNRFEAGAFLDFAFLRFYGNWTSESVSQSSAQTAEVFGAKLFF